MYRMKKSGHQSLWNEVRITENNLRITCLKESAYMLGFDNFLSKLNIEMNPVCEAMAEEKSGYRH